jgi:hypothetical protein
MKDIEEIKVEIALKAYAKESQRKEIIERKTSFLFGLFSIILGGVVLKNDWINNLLKSKGINENLDILLKIEIVLLIIGLIVSLIFILKSLSLKLYKLNYPKHLSEALYGPNGSFNIQHNSKDLLNEYGTFLSLATEDNAKINLEKTKWLKRAWITIIIVSIILIITVLTRLFLNFIL